MKKTIILTLIMCSLLTGISAQTDSVNNLSEVCITSIRAKQTDPIVQTTIDVKELKKFYQGQDVPVLLNFSCPSITFYSDGGNYSGYMYYRLRGVDQTRINATLNGAPLNEGEDNGAYFSNFQDFFSNVGSVQIQRGVGTTSNGSASFIGSLNFQSPSLTDSAYTKLELGKGSFNSSRYSIAVNTGLNKNGFGTYIRYSNISSDGYRENSGTLGNTLFLSTGYQSNKNILKYTMFYGTSKNQMAWLPTNESDILGNDSIQKNRRKNPLTKDENDFFIQNMNILSYSHFVNKKVSFNTSAFYNILDGNYDVNFNPYNDSIFNYKLRSNYYGISSNLNYVYSKVDMSMGISQNYYDRRHMMVLNRMIYQLYHMDNIGRKNQTAVFYKLNYNLTHNLSIYTDLQYRFVNFTYDDGVETWVNGINYSFFNPKIGINYIKRNSRFFTYIGISNREPNRVDIFSSYTSYDPDNVPSNVLDLYIVKPEKVYDYELGYDYNIKHHKISVNYFYMFFENGLLPVGQLNSLGLPINKNVKYSYRTGIEADYTYTLNTFKFYLGSTIMTSKILSGADSIINNQMLLTPNVVINSNIQYSFGKYSVMLLNKYVSRSYLTNTNTDNYLPEYVVTNLNFNYHIKGVGIGFNVNNIFNIDYYNSGQVSNGSRQFFVAAPRNYFVNLSYIF